MISNGVRAERKKFVYLCNSPQRKSKRIDVVAQMNCIYEVINLSQTI